MKYMWKGLILMETLDINGNIRYQALWASGEAITELEADSNAVLKAAGCVLQTVQIALRGNRE